MGREIRRVPLNWQHPKNELGHFRPLHDFPFEDELAEWTEGKRRWDAGEDPKRAEYAAKGVSYSWEEWTDVAPNPAYYRPDWPKETRTAYQVYENVSEGTPISPVFATRDELLAWLTQPDGAPGMGIGGDRQKISPEAAEAFVAAAWAPSMFAMVGDGKGLRSGVEIHEPKP
jgi:hypothetical protein